MALFRYEAVDRAGKVVMGAMDAANEAAVTDRLSQMGYTPQRILPPAGVKTASPSTAIQKTGPVTHPSADMSVGGAKARDMAVFFRQFAVLTRSGISLFQALDNLSSRTPNAGLARTSREMAEAARNGARISDVMERYPRLYPSHVVGSVRAGEMGGFIPVMLEEIAQNYEDDVAFYKWVWLPIAAAIQALIGVALVQPFGALWPEPKFGLFFKLFFFRNLPIALALIFGLWMLAQWLRRPEQRERHDRLVLRAPVFGDLARQNALMSFVRALGRLYQAGVGPTFAWQGAMHVVPNAIIRQKLVDAHAMMQTGNVPLHEAFAATGLFANETEQLLATGVVSGQVVEMMDRITAYYQENVDRARRSAQFWMFRLGCLLTIILTGAALIIITYQYFHGTMNWVEQNFPD